MNDLNSDFKEYHFPVTAVGKPRMTQRDKWMDRDPVVRYRLMKQAVLLFAEQNNFVISDTLSILFIMPMPKHWSNKKREKMNGAPHQVKPDIDNLLKSFMDILAPKNDSHIHTVKIRKVYGLEGRIVVRVYNRPELLMNEVYAID